MSSGTFTPPLRPIQFLWARRAVVASAMVRVVGAALVALGLVLGLRILGAEQFGVSVMALALGQLLAFPLTALERLVIRRVANKDHAGSAAITRRADRYSAVVVAISALLAVLLTVSGYQTIAIFSIASGVTTASASSVIVRQAALRAEGRIGWGQIPNELFRPAVTIAVYPLATWGNPEISGALATLIASAATLGLILAAPAPAGAANYKSKRAVPSLGPAAWNLMVVSVVALGIERVYPLVLGGTSSAVAVSIFAVVVRVAQLANFSQAFAVFFYSPAMASALAEQCGRNREDVQRLAYRIRWLGLATAAPTAALCLMSPGSVERVVGGGLHLESELRFAAVAILAVALGGPAQTLLVMAGRERVVAVAYLLGATASAFAFVIAGASSAWAATAGFVTATLSWNLVQVVMARRILGHWY